MDILEHYRSAWKEQGPDLPPLYVPDSGKYPPSWLRPLRNAVRTELIINTLLGLTLMASLIVFHSTPLWGGLTALFLVSLASQVFYWGLWRSSASLGIPGANMLTHARALRRKLNFIQRTYLIGGLILANLIFAAAVITAFLILLQQASLVFFRPGPSHLLFATALLLLTNVLTYTLLRRWYLRKFGDVRANLEQWYNELKE